MEKHAERVDKIYNELIEANGGKAFIESIVETFENIIDRGVKILIDAVSSNDPDRIIATLQFLGIYEMYREELSTLLNIPADDVRGNYEKIRAFVRLAVLTTLVSICRKAVDYNAYTTLFDLLFLTMHSTIMSGAILNDLIVKDEKTRKAGRDIIMTVATGVDRGFEEAIEKYPRLFTIRLKKVDK